MTIDAIAAAGSAATRTPDVDTSETWGTASRFRRLAQTDPDTAAYWLATVDRVTHRAGHPHLNIAGCPGCRFEQAVAA